VFDNDTSHFTGNAKSRKRTAEKESLEMTVRKLVYSYKGCVADVTCSGVSVRSRYWAMAASGDWKSSVSGSSTSVYDDADKGLTAKAHFRRARWMR